MVKNLDRKARNAKKQTRLTFNPVDRSSSPANGPSPAKIRYELPGYERTPASGLGKSADGSESEDVLSSANGKVEGQVVGSKSCKAGKVPMKGLPTPVKSSQPVFTSGFLGKQPSSSLY